MYFIGIDVGSTSTKTIVLNEEREITGRYILPTGWSSIDTALKVKKMLASDGVDVETAPCVATGYGRISVPYADKTITEITCHTIGAYELFKEKSALLIDIGGQDTKVIKMENGAVCDFTMNDKCSAGTGRFLEVMANSLAIRPDELCNLAAKGCDTTISSMCTVFAETEITSLIGKGEKKENIAYAIVESIVEKVTSQVGRLYSKGEKILLTGGLCECDYLRTALEEKIGQAIQTRPEARFAGALGAAISAAKLKE